MHVRESTIEQELIEKLGQLVHAAAGISARAALERNFREKSEALNRVKLTDAEFKRLLDDIVTPDVFTAAHAAPPQCVHPRRWHPAHRHRQWPSTTGKNDFEVASQFRINTDYSYHRSCACLESTKCTSRHLELCT